MAKSDEANDSREKTEEARQKDKFNSVTQSVKPENQNQQHNTKKVACGPNTER